MKFIEGQPPAHKRPRRKNIDFRKVFDALREQPGVWAELDSGKIATMHSYASRYRGLAHGSFEFRAVRHDADPKRGTLYGRYIAEKRV